MLRIILLSLISIISSFSYADCSCNTYAVIDFSYKQDNGDVKRDTFLGNWWALGRATFQDIYSSNKNENEKIKNLSLESQLELRLNPNSSKDNYPNIYLSKDYLRSVDIGFTPNVKTSRGSDLSFGFASVKDRYRIPSRRESLGDILEIHDLKVGCFHQVEVVPIEIFGVLKNNSPGKIKYIPDIHAVGEEYYKFGYELENEYINVKFKVPAKNCS